MSFVGNQPKGLEHKAKVEHLDKPESNSAHDVAQMVSPTLAAILRELPKARLQVKV